MPVFTSSIEVTADYPTIKPSLNLNFARSRAMDPRVSFERASVGTYVGRDGLIKTAGNNEPRFDHDPVTLESLGLLIEESRTNSQSNSQPQSGSFTGGSATVTYNTATAPNGATEACRIAHNGAASGNSNWRATRSINFNANTMVLSCWAKGSGGNNYFTWSFQNLGGAIFRAGFKLEGDGETSIITNGNGGHTLQIEKYPDGWYRCIIIGNTQSSGSTTQFLYTVSAYNEGSSVNGGSLLVWGFQLEAGSFPTSYIPTSGSAVTRAQDEGNITGSAFSSFFNTTEGVLQTEYSRIGSVNNQMVVQFKDSDGSERIEIRGQGGSADSFRIEVIEGGATSGQEYSFSSGAVVANVVGQFAKVNLAYKQNDFASTINGTIASTDTSGDVGVCDRVGIGYANYGGRYNGHIKNIIYYPKRLTNAQLQLLTS